MDTGGAVNNKQRVFVEEYLKCWNATEAARRAGYKHPNKQGPRLMVNVGIRKEIERRLKEKAITADEVIQRLAEQARADHSQYLTDSGQLDMKRLIADGKGHLIKSIKNTQWGRQVEFYDGQTALVHLGKHLGLFTDKLEVSGNVNLVVSWDDDPNDNA